MSESFFIDPSNKNSIIPVYSDCIFKVNIENFGVISPEKFLISVEKLRTMNLLQIRMCNVINQTNMYLITIDNNLFEKYKLEQSLHVTFDGFVDHLLKILDSCKNGELQITLLKDQNDNVLQFYEKRSFRNLIHLYLPVYEAPIAFILHYINQSLTNYQNQSNIFSVQIQKMQRELEDRDGQIAELKRENQKVKHNLQEQENFVFSRNTEQISRLQQEIKHLNEAKDIEVKRLNITIKNLQDKADSQIKDIQLVNDKLTQETIKSDSLQQDVNHLKLNYISLKEINEKLQSDILAHKNHDRKYEHLLTDSRKHINELQEKCKQLEKLKSDLNAELEAEKHICQTKRNAVQIASDEITKANSIIVKQSKQMVELKKKIDWRTEIALQQEAVIKEKDNECQLLREKLHSIESSNKENLRHTTQFSQKFQQLMNVADNLEDKYRKKFDELAGKISQLDAERTLNKNTQKYLKLSNRI